jgi:hypothetical protein
MINSIEINEEKRIVTVTLTCEEGTFKGVAKCLKSDRFDPAIGEKIAYKRALLQVKKVDIDIFKKEIDACEQVLKQVEVLKKRQRRAKANYKKAKAQLSNIHAEIEKLKHVTETVVKENVQQASLTGRYFVQEVKSEHRPCVRYRFIKVLEQLSNFKSKVYIIEISVCNSGTYKSSSQNMYLDILANDTIRKMEEINEQEFNKYLPQETGSKKHSDLFDAFLSLLNF